MILTIPFGLLSMPRAATIKKSFPKLGDHPRFELAMRVLIVFKVRRNSNAIVALLTFVYPAAGSSRSLFIACPSLRSIST